MADFEQSYPTLARLSLQCKKILSPLNGLADTLIMQVQLPAASAELARKNGQVVLSRLTKMGRDDTNIKGGHPTTLTFQHAISNFSGDFRDVQILAQ